MRAADVGDLAPGEDGIYPSLSVNAFGDVGVASSVTPYSGYYMPSVAQYVFRDSQSSGPNQGWTLPVSISETIPSSSGYVSNPQVVLDGSGLATVIYMGYGVEGVRQLASGAWTNPQPVLQAPNQVSSYTSVDLGLDENGNAIAAASIFDATIGVDRASVYVALGTTDGVWGAQQRITDPSVPVDAYATRVAMSPDGTLAMVGWIDHYHGTVQVAQLAGAIWNTKTIGRGTAFSSFQEVLGLDAGSGIVARAVWKNAKSGTQTMAASYGR